MASPAHSGRRYGRSRPHFPVIGITRRRRSRRNGARPGQVALDPCDDRVMAGSAHVVDMVRWGATGSTSRLVAAVLAARGASFALVGRDLDRLAAVRSALAVDHPAATKLPLLAASRGREVGATTP